MLLGNIRLISMPSLISKSGNYYVFIFRLQVSFFGCATKQCVTKPALRFAVLKNSEIMNKLQLNRRYAEVRNQKNTRKMEGGEN